jgi:hypothetical protein
MSNIQRHAAREVRMEHVRLARNQLDAGAEHNRSYSCPMDSSRVTMSPCFNTPDVCGL